jgi:hydrogenase nickel incorporation protein HypA/HybF
MHELSLMNDLMKKIAAVAGEQGASRVTAVHVGLGALSHMSPAHFRQHFDEAVRGTIAEGATLRIDVATDKSDAYAQDILLKDLEVEIDA